MHWSDCNDNKSTMVLQTVLVMHIFSSLVPPCHSDASLMHASNIHEEPQDLAGNAVLLPKILAQDGLCVAYGSNTPQLTMPFVPMIVRGMAIRCFIVYEMSAAARAECLTHLHRFSAVSLFESL
jgi:hypothetical protein